MFSNFETDDSSIEPPEDQAIEDAEISLVEGDYTTYQGPEIIGFENSIELGSNEHVEALIAENIPAEHVSNPGFESIEYHEGLNPENKGGTWRLDRNENTTSIELYEHPKHYPYLERTLYHEIGHEAQHNLSGEQNRQWETLSTNSSNREHFVSDYAMRSVKEDFAESYAVYVYDPELLQDVSMDKYDFMKNHVFGGREYVK